ncbi:hypothetical protein PF003_g12005 [Phytophthora fragariae]|nr:hypothetical protein PF003_g12005 [Phytophthora fragariae]
MNRVSNREDSRFVNANVKTLLTVTFEHSEVATPSLSQVLSSPTESTSSLSVCVGGAV